MGDRVGGAGALAGKTVETLPMSNLAGVVGRAVDYVGRTVGLALSTANTGHGAHIETVPLLAADRAKDPSERVERAVNGSLNVCQADDDTGNRDEQNDGNPDSSHAASHRNTDGESNNSPSYPPPFEDGRRFPAVPAHAIGERVDDAKRSSDRTRPSTLPPASEPDGHQSGDEDDPRQAHATHHDKREKRQCERDPTRRLE